MAQKVSVDQLAPAVKSGLEEYAKLCAQDMKDAVMKVTKEAKKEVTNNSNARTGRYKKNWSYKKVNENSQKLETVVYNKAPTYRLAHLLEHGHVKVLWGRRTNQRVRAFPHILPVQEKVEKNLEEEIQRRLK